MAVVPKSVIAFRAFTGALQNSFRCSGFRVKAPRFTVEVLVRFEGFSACSGFGVYVGLGA